MYGENEWSSAQAAVPGAVATFSHIHYTGSIPAQVLELTSTTNIELDGLMYHPLGDPVEYTVTEVSDDEAISATITGTELTIETTATMGSFTVSIQGSSSGEVLDYVISVMAVPSEDQTEAVINTADDSPAQAAYPNNTAPFSNSFADLGWTSFFIYVQDPIVSIHLTGTWTSVDYPSEGSLTLQSPSGEVLTLFNASDTNPTALDITLYDFVGQDPIGEWILNIADSYGDGGHQMSNVEVTFNLLSEPVANEDLEDVASHIGLIDNYPNPFNPETTISYNVNYNENVSIEIYNVKGQLVNTLVNSPQTLGNHKVVWNGRDNNNNKVSSGLYFYKMTNGKYSGTKKMILMK